MKATYIGNGIESFVEHNFSTGMNVIYSLDNNRGKTILMQGIMFCLGAIPTFPNRFPFREYTYIVDLECDGKSITVARKHNSFAVKTVDGIQALESVEAFKGFWNDNISELPEIVKDGRAVVAGLELYTQMFFVGQDGLSSAKVNSGHFDKKDFMEMLYSLKGLSARTLESGQVKKAQTMQRGTKRAHKDFKRPSRNTVSRAVFLYHVRPVHEKYADILRVIVYSTALQ